jgi:acyl-CoA thioester hydrolase
VHVNDQPKPQAGAAPRVEDFPHRVADVIRYRDLDPQGHVNQAMFATYFESGRVAMFRSPDLGIGVPGVTFVLVRMEIDYMKELHWPGGIEIGTAVEKFGRSSFTLAQGIFREGVCAARGRATMVCIDLATRRACPVPEELVAKLSMWKVREG